MKRSCARYGTAEPIRTVNPLKVARQLPVRINKEQIKPGTSAIGDDYLLLVQRPEPPEKVVPAAITPKRNSRKRWNIPHRSFKTPAACAPGKTTTMFNPLMLTAALLDKMPES